MADVLKFRNAKGELMDVEQVPASRLKNAPGAILDQAASGRAVVITRHDTPRAVIVSFRDFEALTRARETSLSELEGRFDQLLAGMQSAESRRGVAAAFDASPELLGRTALAAARKQRKGRRTG